MSNESFKMTPEQMEEKSKPPASSARDRIRFVVAVAMMVVLPALSACGAPNKAACQGRFTVGDSEYEMKSHFPYPDQPPRTTLVIGGVERKIYSNPCRPGDLYVENGRLVGWSE